MWLYILLLLIGIIGIAAGILLARRNKKKLWHILTAAAAVVAVLGIVFCTMEIMRLARGDDPAMNGGLSPDGDVIEVGGDWRTCAATPAIMSSQRSDRMPSPDWTTAEATATTTARTEAVSVR